MSKRKEWSDLHLIANALAQHPGWTAMELAQSCGKPQSYRRLSELQKLGLAKQEGARKCWITKKVCALWYPDDRQPEPDRGETPNQQIKRLKERVHFLEAENAKLKLSLTRRTELLQLAK